MREPSLAVEHGPEPTEPRYPTREELYELIRSPDEPEPFDPTVPPADPERHLAKKMPGVGELTWVGDGYVGTMKQWMYRLGFKQIVFVSEYVRRKQPPVYDEYRVGKREYITYHSQHLGPLIARRNGQLKERPKGLLKPEEVTWVRNGTSAKLRVGSTQAWQEETGNSGLRTLLGRRGIEPEVFTYSGVDISYHHSLALELILLERALKLSELVLDPKSGLPICSAYRWAGEFGVYDRRFERTLRDIEARPAREIDDGVGGLTRGYDLATALAAKAELAYRQMATQSIVPGPREPLASLRLWAPMLGLAGSTLNRRMEVRGLRDTPDAALPAPDKGTLKLHGLSKILQACGDLIDNDALASLRHPLTTYRREAADLAEIGIVELDRHGWCTIAGRRLVPASTIIQSVAFQLDDDLSRVRSALGNAQPVLRAFARQAGRWTKPVLLWFYDPGLPRLSRPSFEIHSFLGQPAVSTVRATVNLASPKGDGNGLTERDYHSVEEELAARIEQARIDAELQEELARRLALRQERERRGRFFPAAVPVDEFDPALRAELRARDEQERAVLYDDWAAAQAVQRLQLEKRRQAYQLAEARRRLAALEAVPQWQGEVDGKRRELRANVQRRLAVLESTGDWPETIEVVLNPNGVGVYQLEDAGTLGYWLEHYGERERRLSGALITAAVARGLMSVYETNEGFVVYRERDILRILVGLFDQDEARTRSSNLEE